MWNCTPAVKRVIKEHVDLTPTIEQSSLLICLRFRGNIQCTKTPSDLFHMIKDGSLVDQLESVIFTDDFRDSITDTSDVEVADETQRQQLHDILCEFRIRLHLKLSVSLHQLIDLLLSKQSDITLVVKLVPYASTSISPDDVFDDIYIGLSAMLRAPLNRKLQGTWSQST